MARSYKKSTKKDKKSITEANLLDDLKEIINKARQEESLTNIVTVVMGALRVLALGIVRMVLEERDEKMHNGRKGAPNCPRCGRRMHKPRKKQAQRATLLGWLRYRRRSWLCKNCHKSHSPLDATLGLVVLHHGHSLEFVKKLSRV